MKKSKKNIQNKIFSLDKYNLQKINYSTIRIIETTCLFAYKMQNHFPKLQKTFSSHISDSNSKQTFQSSINSYKQYNLQLQKKISAQTASINSLNYNKQKLLQQLNFYKQLLQFQTKRSQTFKKKFQTAVEYNRELLRYLELYQCHLQDVNQLSEKQSKQIQLLKQACNSIQGFQFNEDSPKMPKILDETMNSSYHKFSEQQNEQQENKSDTSSLWSNNIKSLADQYSYSDQSKQLDELDKNALEVGLQTLVRALSQSLKQKKFCLITETHQVTLLPISSNRQESVDAFQVKQPSQTTVNSEERNLSEQQINLNQPLSLNLTIEALKMTFQELDPMVRNQWINKSVEQLPENQRNAVQMFFKNHKKQHKRNKMKKSPEKQGQWKKLNSEQFQREMRINLKNLYELNKKYRPHKQHKKGHKKGK